MEKERSIDRLARILIFLGAAAIVCTLCWYFRSVLVYIITAFVVSLIGHPVMNLLRKIRVRGKAAPDSVLAVISLVILSSVLIFVVTQVIPWVGADFDVAQLLLEKLSELTDFSSVPGIVGSVASAVATMAVGMLVAIPAYTVIRVIASRFFYEYKAVRRLIPDREN